MSETKKQYRIRNKDGKFWGPGSNNLIYWDWKDRPYGWKSLETAKRIVKYNQRMREGYYKYFKEEINYPEIVEYEIQTIEKRTYDINGNPKSAMPKDVLDDESEDI